MSEPEPAHPTPGERPDDRPKGDPWHAVGYLVAGVGLYGALGWLLDYWLGTRFLVVVGILLGAGLGIYLTVKRFDAITRTARDRGPGRGSKDVGK